MPRLDVGKGGHVGTRIANWIPPTDKDSTYRSWTQKPTTLSWRSDSMNQDEREIACLACHIMPTSILYCLQHCMFIWVYNIRMYLCLLMYIRWLRKYPFGILMLGVKNKCKFVYSMTQNSTSGANKINLPIVL